MQKNVKNGEVYSLEWFGLEHGEDVREKEPFVTISSRIVFSSLFGTTGELGPLSHGIQDSTCSYVNIE